MAEILEKIQDGKIDGIEWQADRWFTEAGSDKYAIGNVSTKLGKLLALVKEESVRNYYIDAFYKRCNLSKKQLRDKVVGKRVEAIGDDDEGEDPWAGLPTWMDKDELEESGFCAAKGDEKVQGYWGWGREGRSRLTNFVIVPHFHVYQKEESRHIFEIENHRKRVVMDVPSRVFSSVETFQNHLIGEGNFLIYGSNNQLKNISTKLLDHFPICHEIKQLGWQPEGFYAFVNNVYVPGDGFKEISKWGITEVHEKKYLIPATSEAYKDLRASDDPFENDKVMHYTVSPVRFNVWAKQMHIVYGDHGSVCVGFTLVTIFRDIVFNVDHNCPHLYLYGERSSGKSKCAESVTSVFYVGRSAFQLNSGTDFAFFNYMQRFINCPAHLNEFDDKVTKDEWFQAIKGVFDGEGRERGKMNAGGSSRNRTEVQRVNGTLILTGQYISTKDDNSVVSRSIICPFFERQFTEEEKAAFDQLKRWEAEGMTSLVTDVLEYRSMVKEQYYNAFNEILSGWIRQTTEQFNQRILKNWCHLATMWTLFRDALNLPIKSETYQKYCYAEAMKYSQFIRDSDTLSDFWNTVAFLADNNEIQEGWDYRIDTATEVKIRAGNGEEYVHQFDKPVKLLYIRLENIHKLYQTAYRARTGKEAMNFESLKHYFSNRPYYIGQMKQKAFKRYVYKTFEKQPAPLPFGQEGTPQIASERKKEQKVTSCYVFAYDLLGCELENHDEANGGEIHD